MYVVNYPYKFDDRIVYGDKEFLNYDDAADFVNQLTFGKPTMREVGMNLDPSHDAVLHGEYE